MSERKYIHPQALQKMIVTKRKQVSELQEQCKEHGIKTRSRNTIEDLNLQYLNLKAENKVMKNSNPNVIPRCKTLLFEWVHQKLQEDVKNLEELLSFQKDMKKITLEKESELKKICHEDTHQFSKEFEDAKETENFRSEILIYLHEKLIRRMRRITREYFPAVAINQRQDIGDSLKQGKSLFSILQALFPDLKENTLKPDEWEKVEGTYIKTSYPQEYLELLLASEIVYIDDERPNFMKIMTK